MYKECTAHTSSPQRRQQPSLAWNVSTAGSVHAYLDTALTPRDIFRGKGFPPSFEGGSVPTGQRRPGQHDPTLRLGGARDTANAINLKRVFSKPQLLRTPPRVSTSVKGQGADDRPGTMTPHGGVGDARDCKRLPPVLCKHTPRLSGDSPPWPLTGVTPPSAGFHREAPLRGSGPDYGGSSRGPTPASGRHCPTRT